jgi:hypothetical protein
MFKIQGISVDPHNLHSIGKRIITCCNTGYGDGITKFDCFLSYRVLADKDLVEKIYWQLKAHGAHPFLDSVCLSDAQDWKQGFLKGLQHSRAFVAVISKKSLEQVRRSDIDHRFDNILIEYESALAIYERKTKELHNTKYIIPLLVGEYTKGVDGCEHLTKFQDFRASLYADSISATTTSSIPSTLAINIPASPISPIATSFPSTPFAVSTGQTEYDRVWALLQDPKCWTNSSFDIPAYLDSFGINDASDIEYLSVDVIEKIAGKFQEMFLFKRNQILSFSVLLLIFFIRKHERCQSE